MTIQQWKVTEPYIAIPCKLGEGVFYNSDRHELRFVDIINSKLYVVDIAKGPDSIRKIDTSMPIGVTADIEGVDSSQVILAGAKDGVTKFNLNTGKHEHIVRYWSDDDKQERPRRMRSNDGAADSQGRFWVGVLVDPNLEEPTDEGMVFRLDPNQNLETMYEKIVIPNGGIWSADNRTMFLADTTIGKIHAFDFDEKTGGISNQRTFYHHKGEGHPDGHALDVEGNIWQALYGGSKVIRISPEGIIIGEVHLPTRNITCVAFAGTELYITSAAESNPGAFPESAKYGGNVFKIDVGVTGVPKHKVLLAKT